MLNLLSLFSPKTLETVHSKYSGEIRVVSTWGYKYLATGVLTQSGGLVRDVWEPVLKKFKTQNSKIKNILILGLAGGTIAKICSDYLHPDKIVGIEIDSQMIRLGKKYLDLGKIPNLEIKIIDAKKYLDNPQKQKFDLILVDMYLGDQLPEFVYQEKFLKKLRQLGQLVIFNHLFYDEAKRQKGEELVRKLQKIFPSVTLKRKLTNLLIICS